jgi:hypothetical protein
MKLSCQAPRSKRFFLGSRAFKRRVPSSSDHLIFQQPRRWSRAPPPAQTFSHVLISASPTLLFGSGAATWLVLSEATGTACEPRSNTRPAISVPASTKGRTCRGRAGTVAASSANARNVINCMLKYVLGVPRLKVNGEGRMEDRQ